MSPSMHGDEGIDIPNMMISDYINSDDNPNHKVMSTKEDSFIHSPLEAHHILVQVVQEKQMHVEEAAMRNSTLFHATINCLSLLLGLGILSSPYAVAKSGWAATVISTVLAFGYWYTASLMVHCQKVYPQLTNYEAIASKAFGSKGRVLIVTLFYMEIMGTLVGYCISMGDNLSYIFPNTRLSMAGLSSKNLMMLIASLCVLPSVWLRDLSMLSFATIWCVLSSVVLLVAVLFAAIDGGIGFHHPLQFLHIHGVPVAAGLYAFAYGGTGVFPAVHMSMKDPSTFHKASVISFIIATAAQAGLGIAGAAMFGPDTKAQVTLSMPKSMVASKVVLWMTVMTPITKFALLFSPLSNEVERVVVERAKAIRVPSHLTYGVATLARSMLLALITIIAMVLPYFEYIIALIGSSMTITICMILPSLYYLKIFHASLTLRTLLTTTLLITIGMLAGIVGTITSFKGLIQSKQNKRL